MTLMTVSAPAKPDPLLEAQQRLFPALRNRILSRAADALAGGHAHVAEPLVSNYLRRDPASPDALNLMADIARRGGRLEEAEELLSRCVERSPQEKGYRYNYALVLKARNKFKQAIAQLDELLDREPRNPLFRDQKARILGSIAARHSEALEYRRGLARDYPDYAPFWLLCGDFLRGPGHRDECVSAYHKALALDPSRAEIYQRLSDLKTYRFMPEEIRQMETLLASPGTSPEDRTNLHFSLGRAYGDLEDFAKSYDNYLKGNALRRLALGANPGRITTHRQNCEALFTREFFAERRGWGCDSPAPIFIVGLPRSGSTLIEQILSSHSAIEGLGELKDLERIIIRRLACAGEPSQPQTGEENLFEAQADLLRAYPLVVAALRADDYRQMGEEYLARVTARRRLKTPFFTDKALSNFGHAGLIRLMLPNAKIIDARRHPLSCGWSCFSNYFPNGMRFTYRLDDIGRHYTNYVQIMSHFERVVPGKIHRVIYEQMVAEPETEIRRLLDYLELPFEEQCLRFHENKRSVATLSSEQVRQPLYTSGVDQWVPYEPWLGPLKAELGAVLDCYPLAPDQQPERAGDLSRELVLEAQTGAHARDG